MPLTEVCINSSHASSHFASLMLYYFVCTYWSFFCTCFLYVCTRYNILKKVLYITPLPEIEWGRRIEEGRYLVHFHLPKHSCSPLPSYLDFKHRRKGSSAAAVGWACVRDNGECASSVLLLFCHLPGFAILAVGID